MANDLTKRPGSDIAKRASTDIVKRPKTDIVQSANRPLAVFDKPLNHITTAIGIGNKLLQKQFNPWGLNRHRGCVPTAIVARAEQLPHFLEADVASLLLYRALGEKLNRPVAVEMITALYRAVGVKPGEESAGMLGGSLDMLEADAIGQATGLWRPLNVSPAILALACRKLINTSVFPPKPAELRAACEEAGQNLRMVHKAADDVVDQVRTADAILLAFNYDEWKRAYQSPQSRPVLARMLELHDIYGDGDERADESVPAPFEQLIKREQTKLTIEQAPRPKKIAAARRRSSDRNRGPLPKRESAPSRVTEKRSYSAATTDKCNAIPEGDNGTD